MKRTNRGSELAYPVYKAVVLPLRARLFLCSTCGAALRQTIDDYREGAEVISAALAGQTCCRTHSLT